MGLCTMYILICFLFFFFFRMILSTLSKHSEYYIFTTITIYTFIATTTRSSGLPDQEQYKSCSSCFDPNETGQSGHISIIYANKFWDSFMHPSMKSTRKTRQKSERLLAGNKSLHLLVCCPFPGKLFHMCWCWMDPLNPFKDDLWKQLCASNTVECGQHTFTAACIN